MQLLRQGKIAQVVAGLRDKPEVLAELRDFAMNEKETTAQEQLTRPIGQEISENNLRAYISKVYTKNKCT